MSEYNVTMVIELNLVTFIVTTYGNKCVQMSRLPLIVQLGIRPYMT